jgi:hypothetical protein
VDLGFNERAKHIGEVCQTNGSYDNDHTNIDKLQKIWLADKDSYLSVSVYVEGIGTVNNEADQLCGKAFGTGDTGILAKVDIGIRKIVNKISKKVKDRKIEHIYLDTFGFSRGAAAARYFVYAVLKKDGDTLKDKLSAKGFCVDIVKVKFVGLYDTVASYQVIYGNNTEQLHLDSIESAERVVQLAAADEHRANFRLTNINSAPNRLQVFLPGSHSDIGGGYRDNHKESFTVFYYKLPNDSIDKISLDDSDKEALDRERHWLIESGWYLNEEITNVCPAFSDFCSLKVERNNIENKYCNISLKLMTDFAHKAGIYFASSFRRNPVPPELENVEDMIRQYIRGLGSDQSHPDDWMKCNSSIMRSLRYGHLHFSSQYFSIFGANDPQFTHSDPKSGERKRIIQNG